MPDTSVPQPMFSAPDMPEPLPSMSVWSRMANVIAAPGEAFDGIVGHTKRNALWIVPVLIMIVITLGNTAVVLNNPAIQSKVRQGQAKQYEDLVRDGKMTQEQADKALDMQQGGMMKVIGMIGAVIGVPLMWLIVTTVMFMVVSFVLGGEVNFSDVWVVIALASVVSMLELIVTGLMQYATGDFLAQPSLGFLAAGSDNPYFHAVMMRINPFSFWWIFVLGIGLSKVSTISAKKATIGVAGVWLLFSGIMIGLAGLPMFQAWNK